MIEGALVASLTIKEKLYHNSFLFCLCLIFDNKEEIKKSSTEDLRVFLLADWNRKPELARVYLMPLYVGVEGGGTHTTAIVGK